MRGLVLIISILLSTTAFSQVFQNKVFAENIKTLQVYNSKDVTSLPLVELNSDEKIVVSFDEMEYSEQAFFYRIVHCNRDFSRSSLAEMEYFSGFVENQIYDVNLSQNTLTHYAHYRVEIPEGSDRFKVSGNYAILIAKDQDFENPVATARFYVSEEQADISARVSGNTQKGFSTAFQQLDIEVNNSKLNLTNAIAELNLCVMQNRREDNKVIDIKPTFTSNYKLQYLSHKSLVFYGGNEYRFIDFSSEYAYSGEIDKIDIKPGYYTVFTTPAYPRHKASLPTSHGNAFGRFIINRKSYWDSDFTADYMWVNFVLPNDLEYYGYDIYILGDFLGNDLIESAKMELLPKENIYHKSLLLKQGGYSFLYAFVPKKGSREANLQLFEGSYWQTQNEYSILLYYTPWGSQYDRLIATKIIK